MGHGPKLVLAFHGYGNSAELFRFLSHPEYTVLSIDLPCHGKSGTTEQSPMNKTQMKAMVLSLMKTHNVTRLSLAGYSMGGRIALVISEMMPECLERVVLIAPDGLRFNYFYFFLTRTWIGRVLFNDFTKHSNRYRTLLSLTGTLGLAGKSRIRFAQQQISSPEAVAFLHRAWKSTQMLIPDMKLLRRQLSKYRVPVHLVMGAFDKIIPPSLAQQFRHQHPEVPIALYIAQRGHLLYEHPEVQREICLRLFNPGSDT
jgi:pimeloyl-ACP methyl ester carboxylesterase